MKNLAVIFCVAIGLALGGLDSLFAGGFKGGGRARGGSLGGARPSSMPHMGGGMSRRAMPAVRPPVSRPSVAPPSFNRPSRPAIRPSAPSIRPGTPSVRPSAPTTRPANPSTRPGLPGGGGWTGGMKPQNRPSTLPSRPVLPNRPGGAPSTRPSLPSLGGGAGRPSTLPGNANRPSAGNLGDFLGIPGGVRPEARPSTRPNIANRPGATPASPGALRPGMPGRPGGNQRPINIGAIQVGNRVINNRPSWVQIDRNRISAINGRWQNQIGSLHGWVRTQPARIGYWRGWGNGVRFRWNHYHYHYRWFAGDWWYGHPGGVCRWHYYRRFNYYPWSYWWRRPAWGIAAGWFTWSAPPSVWSEPVYYDYGSGGNVTVQNNQVTIGGQTVATADEFAQSAADLATVQPPASEEQADQTEWLPLGTFALSTDQSDVEPSRVVQLAVDRTGIIAGTMYNRDTDQADAIQGRVDKETQRVAFRFGESDQVVAETGLYNLTQDEAPLLVHFGKDRVENYILVRLDPPNDQEEDAGPGLPQGVREADTNE